MPLSLSISCRASERSTSASGAAAEARYLLRWKRRAVAAASARALGSPTLADAACCWYRLIISHCRLHAIHPPPFLNMILHARGSEILFDCDTYTGRSLGAHSTIITTCYSTNQRVLFHVCVFVLAAQFNFKGSWRADCFLQIRCVHSVLLFGLSLRGTKYSAGRWMHLWA